LFFLLRLAPLSSSSVTLHYRSSAEDSRALASHAALCTSTQTGCAMQWTCSSPGSASPCEPVASHLTHLSRTRCTPTRAPAMPHCTPHTRGDLSSKQTVGTKCRAARRPTSRRKVIWVQLESLMRHTSSYTTLRAASAVDRRGAEMSEVGRMASRHRAVGWRG
jgi:hypothetical protein